MALSVSGSFETPIGTTVGTVYWRWVGLGIDVSRTTATVTLYAYVDEAAFAAGKTPIDTKQVTLNGADFGAVAARLEAPDNPGLSAIIYDHCKTHLPEFADAVDA